MSGEARRWIGRLLPKYEVWTYFTKGGVRVSEPKFRGPRRWTRRGAEKWGEAITNNPQILAASLRSLRDTRDGYMLFVDFEVRP